MATMEIHPIADAFPMLDKAALDQLADSIKKVGQQIPIVVLKGKILDGRCRAAACKIAKVKPATVQYDGPTDTGSLIAFVDAVNDKRRHLTPSQRAVAAFKLTKIRDAGGKSAPTQDQAAQQLSVSASLVKQVGKVAANGAPSLLAAVESGDVKVKDAASIVDLSKSSQTAALKKVQRGESRTLKAAAAEFDTAKMEKQAARRSGKELHSPKLKKEAFRSLGVLVRVLDKLKLSADAEPHLKAINKLIKDAT